MARLEKNIPVGCSKNRHPRACIIHAGEILGSNGAGERSETEEVERGGREILSYIARFSIFSVWTTSVFRVRPRGARRRRSASSLA